MRKKRLSAVILSAIVIFANLGLSSNLVGANETKDGEVNSQIIDLIKKTDGLESEKTVVNLSQGDFDSEDDEIENPQNPDEPEDPETPDEPEDPETPEAPEEPEDPETPEAPEDPETPDEPEEPEVPDEPEAPEEPEDDEFDLEGDQEPPEEDSDEDEDESEEPEGEDGDDEDSGEDSDEEPEENEDGPEDLDKPDNPEDDETDLEGDQEPPEEDSGDVEPEEEIYRLVNRISSQNLGVKKKESQVTAKLGDILRYTIRVTNTDYSSTSKKILVVDNIPDGLDFIDSSLKIIGGNYEIISSGNKRVEVKINDLLDGQTVEISFDVRVSEKSSKIIRNIAEVTDTGVAGLILRPHVDVSIKGGANTVDRDKDKVQGQTLDKKPNTSTSPQTGDGGVKIFSYTLLLSSLLAFAFIRKKEIKQNN